jgi:Icc-related predicted phosphoesterase
MTKIVCFSDIHGQMSKSLKDWFINNPGDILLFAGDIQVNQTDDGKAFLAWVHSLPFEFKVITFGNHDSNAAFMLEEARSYKDITILNHQAATIKGIKIFASPYSLPFGSWWFMASEAELKNLYEAIPEDTEMLVTHGGAFEILDKTVRGDSTGSTSLRNRIGELPNLKYHVHGHIHEAYGGTEIDGVTRINCSVLNEAYKLRNNPVILNLLKK